MRAWIPMLVCAAIAGCTAAAYPTPSPSPTHGSDAAPTPIEDDGDPGYTILEAPQGDGFLREPPIVVRMIDASTGLPIAGATVALGTQAGPTDGDGFIVLRPRDGTIRISAAGFGRVEFDRPPLGAVALQPARPLRLQITTLAGAPLPGVRVQCHDPRGPRSRNLSDWATSDTAGWVELFDVAPGPDAALNLPRHGQAMPGWVGVSELGISHDGLVWRAPAPFSHVLWGRSFDADAGHRVELRVRDQASGAPLEGVALALRCAEPPYGYWCRTDADGVAALTLPPELVVAEAASPFHPVGLTPKRCEIGSDTSAVEFTAHPRPTLTVPTGAIPSEARLWLIAEGAAYPVVGGQPIHVPAETPLAVRIVHGARDEIRPIDSVGWGEAKTLDLEVPPPLPPPVFEAPPAWKPEFDAPTGTLVISVRDTRGRFCSGQVSLDGAPPRRGARITFDRVPCGAHRVVVWAEGREVLVEPVTVGADAVVKLAARLRALP